MPRSVNHVASKARRKRPLNKRKGTSEEEKMYGRYLKTPLKKV